MKTSYYKTTTEFGFLWIDEIHVCEADRRKGIASRFIDEIKTKASQLRLNIKIFAIPTDNVPQDVIVDFYKKNGFDFAPEDCDNTLMIWD